MVLNIVDAKCYTDERTATPQILTGQAATKVAD